MTTTGRKPSFFNYPAQFYILAAGNLVVTTGGSMVWPFLTIYLRQTLDLPLGTITFLLMINSGMSFLSSILAGPLIDRVGRKGIMTISMFATAVYYILMSQADQFWMFAVLMGLGGLFNPLYPVGSNAMIADLVPSEQRTDAYALLRVAHNVGVALGPAIGGFITAVSYDNAFYTGAAAFLFFAIFNIFFIRETLPTGTQIGEAGQTSSKGYGPVLADRRFLLFMGMFTLTMMSASVMFLLLPVYTNENFNLPESRYGFIVTANALMCIFVQYFVTLWTKRQKHFVMLGVGALFYAVGVGSVALGRGFTAWVISMVIMTIGELIATPTATSLVANLAPMDMRGRYMSIYQLTWPAASLGPVIAGYFNDNFSPAAIWYCGFFYGLLGALGFFVLHRIYGKRADGLQIQPADPPVA